jgi:FKBP-type peptidyl-prolyl cis-trans isomerase
MNAKPCRPRKGSARLAALAAAALAGAAMMWMASSSPAAAAAPKASKTSKSGKGLAAPADVAAPPADAQTTPSGLASKVLRPGTGDAHPGPTDQVTVHYTGWTTDGKMFDTSVGGKPATFPLDHVIPGWSEGVQLMVVGEKRRFWIPEKLAYAGKLDRPQGMLVFDVELLEIGK